MFGFSRVTWPNHSLECQTFGATLKGSRQPPAIPPSPTPAVVRRPTDHNPRSRAMDGSGPQSSVHGSKEVKGKVSNKDSLKPGYLHSCIVY